jgi:hypothetical protein
MKIVLAPVPCIHLFTASGVPALASRVAFGTSQPDAPNLPANAPVFICASHPEGAPPEALRLLRPGFATWTGTLLRVVRAVDGGRRSGKHEDPSVRPPSAEANDGPFQYFWEVSGLRQLPIPRALGDFHGEGPMGNVPRWPIIAELGGYLPS